MQSGQITNTAQTNLGKHTQHTIAHKPKRFLVCSWFVCYCVLCVFSQVCLCCIGNLAILHVVICEWLRHLLPPVCFWLQVFMCVCVCAQVGCSVVRNRSLCDLSVDVCVLICSGFVFYLQSLIYIFCSWDTRWWIKSINTIRSILIHHRQNPTKMTYSEHLKEYY
jgi:hypothetical protein